MARGKTRRGRRRPPRQGAAAPCRSGKLRYRDRLGAEIALASTERGRASSRDEKRVYRCPDCAGWHLTSRGRRTW